MPSLDAASAAYNLIKAVTGAVTIGPILIGPRQPAHIVNASVTSRGIVNMSAVACVHALGAARQRLPRSAEAAGPLRADPVQSVRRRTALVDQGRSMPGLMRRRSVAARLDEIDRTAGEVAVADQEGRAALSVPIGHIRCRDSPLPVDGWGKKPPAWR